MRKCANIVDVMERWARWSSTRSDGNGLGWPHITIIGRVLEGMPSTQCTLCHGAGKVSGWKVGAHSHFVHCPRCAGAGKIKAAPSTQMGAQKPCRHCKKGEVNGKTCFHCCGSGYVVNHAGAAVNPAFIRSTLRAGHHDNDPLAQRIDWLVCTVLSDDLRMVVYSEYLRSGTQAYHAKRLGISQGYFSKLLAEAHDIIEANLLESAAN